MANRKKNNEGILSLINSLQSALLFDYGNNRLTVNLSSISGDILSFIVDYIRSVEGEKKLIETISKFISTAVPVIEDVSKVILIGYIETLLSCSVKPFITKKHVNEGVYFDLQKIDIFQKLYFQPSLKSGNLDVNNIGKYLYFGTEELDKIIDLKNATDFDAFLWYVKNTPGVRHTWRREKDKGKEKYIKPYTSGDLYKYTKIDVNGDKIITYCKENNGSYTSLTGESIEFVGELNKDYFLEKASLFNRQPKSNGIVTLEYNAKSSNLSNYDKSEPLYVEEPIQNCLQVFFGCAEPIIDDNLYIDSENKIKECERLIGEIKIVRQQLIDLRWFITTEYLTDNFIDEDYISTVNKIKDLMEQLTFKINVLINSVNGNVKDKKIINGLKEIDSDCSSNSDFIIDFDEYLSYSNPVNENGESISTKVEIKKEWFNTSLSLLEDSKIDNQNNIKTILTSDVTTYPDVDSNYYLNHPLLEFNIDLIYSMKWFDEKVLTAQLINSLFGCFKNSIPSISFQVEVIEKMVENLITKVIKNSDISVNDCFFSFNNDDYNSMLEKTELNRLGINTINDNTLMNTVTPESVLHGLNNISSNSTKEEIMTAISGSIMSAIISESSGENGISTNFDLHSNPNANVFNIILEKLLYAIVSTFLAPKIYMIIMLNLKVLGLEQSPTFDITRILTYIPRMMRDIVLGIMNVIIEYYTEIIMESINRILSLVKPLFLQEQYNYYTELINGCRDCFTNATDWNMADVNYADIETVDEELSTNNEC